jgi:probable HAF family extracellular repeat protein
MTNLGVLPGGSDTNSWASGINDAGQVVGYSYAAAGGNAFLWQNGIMTNLGELPGGGDDSFALGINNAGQVVGSSAATNGQSAFLWQNGVMTDLSTVSGVVGTGWSLIEATAINDAGQIVGYGINPQGVTSAFILTPVPEPEVYLMMGAGVCLAGVIARRRKKISQ